MLYSDDDSDLDPTRNAVQVVSRGGTRGPSTLRPVNLRPVGVARQPTYAQPGFAQQGFAQPGYAQPGYLQPGFAGYPGFPGYPDPRFQAQPWGWVGPNGQVFYGSPANTWASSSASSADTVASAISSVFEVGAALLAAFTALPTPPNSEESTVLANVTDYQSKLADHAKADEKKRVLGQTAGRALGFAYKLFANRPSNAFAPRWF